MITRFNRFAIFPVLCNCCKRYIWLSPYRRADVWYAMPGRYWKERICGRCIDAYLPYIKKEKENGKN